MPEIDTDKVYKQLKKQNGEESAKVIRDAVLLDVPNIVHILEFAGNNPDEIRSLVPIIREIYKTQKESEYNINKTPLELLNNAGYDAFVVKTLEQKDSIKKYFRKDEELCTFRDPTRHENYYMIHAVKRGADKIKPSDNPERQDEYGTSVISIQIVKTGGFISIKNRYNHTVVDPDATFNNNPDEIIPGLTNSLKRFFHVDFNTAGNPMPNGYRMVNDQLVRYHYEINNIYFGGDYYFSGSNITKLNKDYQIMLDCFVLDTRTGKIENLANLNNWNYPHDSTYNVLQKLFQDKKIKVGVNPKNKKERIIFADGKSIMSVFDGQMTELNLSGIEKIDDNCLGFANRLRILDMPDVREIGDDFLHSNFVLNYINVPKLQKTGQDFLTGNRKLTELNFPELETMGRYSLQNNHNIESVYAPKCSSYLGNLSSDQPNLKNFYAPNLSENTLEWWAKNSTEIAIQIAKARVQKKIDDLVNENKKDLDNKISVILSGQRGDNQ